MTLRVVFMGTPDFAVPTLAEIVGGGQGVDASYTRAPAAAGRGMALKPSPVQQMAERFGIPVMTPKTLRSNEAADRNCGQQKTSLSQEIPTRIRERHSLPISGVNGSADLSPGRSREI